MSTLGAKNQGNEENTQKRQSSANVHLVMKTARSKIQINAIALGDFRQALGYSTAELAAEVGISPKYLWDLEAGRRYGTPKVIRQLASALGVRVPAIILDPNGYDDPEAAA